MLKQALIYCAAFVAAFALYFALMTIVAIDPNLSWKIPILAPLIGMTFPGGAPFEMHFLSHAAQTWLPFVLAYRVSRRLTSGKARASGAVMLYAVFLLWSGVIGLLMAASDRPFQIFFVGLAGTFFGGFGLYLALVAPRPSDQAGSGRVV